MHYLTLTLTPTARAIHPIDSFVADHQSVARDAILHVDQPTDGSVVLLYRLEGNDRAFASALDGHPGVEDHEVVDVGDGFHAFVQAAPANNGGYLLTVAQRNALMIDTPLEFVAGGLRATLVSTPSNLRESLSSFPDELSFSVEDAGSYSLGEDDPLSPLTDRQLEVFEAAVEEGYYEVPRRATNQDIADELDCAPSTVDQHLRKAESRILSELVR